MPARFRTAHRRSGGRDSGLHCAAVNHSLVRRATSRDQITSALCVWDDINDAMFFVLLCAISGVNLVAINMI